MRWRSIRTRRIAEGYVPWVYVRYDFKERERDFVEKADFLFFFKSNKNGRRNGKKVQVDKLFIYSKSF